MLRILRGLGSRALACGCLVGFYETYANETVAIVDAKGAGCTDPEHRVDSSIDVPVMDQPAQPPSTMPTVSR
jgi:hypothetical protein